MRLSFRSARLAGNGFRTRASQPDRRPSITTPPFMAFWFQLPLPGHIDSGRVIQTIAPEKDVDGFHFINVEQAWHRRGGNGFRSLHASRRDDYDRARAWPRPFRPQCRGDRAFQHCRQADVQPPSGGKCDGDWLRIAAPRTCPRLRAMPIFCGGGGGASANGQVEIGPAGRDGDRCGYQPHPGTGARRGQDKARR